jgi:hypothetical protein
MRTLRITLITGLLAVSGVAALASPPDGPGPRRPFPRFDACSRNAVACLYGVAPGCSVSCLEPLIAQCTPAGCLLGFPIPAQCRCVDC